MRQDTTTGTHPPKKKNKGLRESVCVCVQTRRRDVPQNRIVVVPAFRHGMTNHSGGFVDYNKLTKEHECLSRTHEQRKKKTHGMCTRTNGKVIVLVHNRQGDWWFGIGQTWITPPSLGAFCCLYENDIPRVDARVGFAQQHIVVVVVPSNQDLFLSVHSNIQIKRKQRRENWPSVCTVE